MLHNLCIEENVPLINDDDGEDFDLGVYNLPVALNEDIRENRQNQDLIAGRRFRQNIVNRMFVE